MKKLLSMFLTIAIVICMVPLGAFTFKVSAETDGYYTYYEFNNKATITYVDRSISGDITIPSTLGGYSVTSIGDSAFYSCDSLISITIPDSVTSIGDSAFDNCDSLISITIPDSVTSIGNYAFYDCDSLASITIPDSVTSIGNYAFYSCASLTNVYITDIAAWCDINFGNTYSNPLYYADDLYLNGELVTDVVIPDGVTTIPDYLFSCDSLASITIPDSVTSIGDSAFDNCDSLISITIPNSVTSIGNSAFYDCDSLASITLPDSVTSIGDYAFYGCENLKNVWYCGSEEAKNIYISDYGNSYLEKAVWEYNDSFNMASLGINGDVNDDNAINNKDIALLVQYINGWNVTVNINVLDVYKDSNINNKDYVWLMRYVNNWNINSDIGNRLGFTIYYFNAQDAENSNPVTISGKNDEIILSDAVKAGYTFDGWYKDGAKIISIPADTNSNVALIAQWTPLEYGITYENTKGATNTNPTSYDVESDSIVLDNLEKAGYKFNGWYNGDKQITEIPSGTAGDMILTASWTPIEYTATFIADGNTIATRTFTVEDTVISDLPIIPQKQNYTAEWSSYTIKAADIYIYVVYSPIGYTITYENTNDVTNLNPTSYNVESDFELKDISMDGYKFDGWYNGDVKVTKIEEGTIGDITLRAKWLIVEYTASFVSDGNVVATRTFTVEDTEIDDIPTVPEKEYMDGAWEEYEIKAQNLIINAVYSVKKGYTRIKFNANGHGTVKIDDIFIKYGERLPDVLTGTIIPEAGYVINAFFDFPDNSNYGGGYWQAIDGVMHVPFTSGITWTSREPEVTMYAQWYRASWDFAEVAEDIGSSKHFVMTQGACMIQLSAKGTTNVVVKSYSGDTILSKTYNSGTHNIVLEANPGTYYITTSSTKSGGVYLVRSATGYIEMCDMMLPSNTPNITYTNTKGAVNINPTYLCAMCMDSYYLFPIKQDGYIFEGWYLNGEEVTCLRGSNILNATNIELTAKMTPITYTADFYLYGEKVGSSEFNMDDECIANCPEVPHKEHYIGSWVYDIVPRDIIITKYTYTPVEYSITYTNLYDATNENVTTYNIEKSIVLKEPVRKHYNFAGWYLNGEKITEIPVGTTGDITLVADWTPIPYTVTFSSCFGDVPDAITCKVGYLSLPTLDDLEDYYFYGWNLNGKYIKGGEIYVDGNITLVAAWAKKDYDFGGNSFEQTQKGNVSIIGITSTSVWNDEFHCYEVFMTIKARMKGISSASGNLYALIGPSYVYVGTYHLYWSFSESGVTSDSATTYIYPHDYPDYLLVT